MTRPRARTSFFAALRRDGRLFAALATLLLLFSGFSAFADSLSEQPICTGEGQVSPSGSKPALCKHCLAAGSSCTAFGFSAKALPADAIPKLHGVAAQSCGPNIVGLHSLPRSTEFRPGIRAPPLLG